MKKYFALLTVIVLLAVTVIPAFAYSGVSGTAYDFYGNPWQHGGTVYIIGTTVNGGTNTLIGSTALSTSPGTYGQFAFSWAGLLANDQPTDFTNVSIVIVFNNGGLGTPPTQQYTNQFTQFTFIPGSYSLGNVDTGTGPTAITLDGITTGSQSSLPLIAGLTALALAGVSLVAIRRRNAA